MPILESGTLELTPYQAVAVGVYSPVSVEDFTKLPYVYENQNWTPFQQLRAFAEKYKREADAPIQWKKDGLHWTIPPVVHRKVNRLVVMSATLHREGFERAFSGISTAFIDTPDTTWHENARAFQVKSGVYPRTSLIEYSDNWETPVKLNKSGRGFLTQIENEIARDRSIEHVIITFTKIVEWERERLLETHENLNRDYGVISFHQMEGLDLKKSGLVVWVFGCPEVSSDVIEQNAKILYGGDELPLDYERCSESREFTDPRVQSCWVSEVVGRLQQAIGRARLNRLGNTVVVYSNVLIPGFTGGAIGFVPEDLDVAGDLSSMEKIALDRVDVEKRVKELTGENTITDFQAVYGCSERHALRLWTDAGGKDKKIADDNAFRSQILELQCNQGLSLRL